MGTWVLGWTSECRPPLTMGHPTFAPVVHKDSLVELSLHKVLNNASDVMWYEMIVIVITIIPGAMAGDRMVEIREITSINTAAICSHLGCFLVSLLWHSMTISSLASSDASSASSEGDPSVQKPCSRWLPRSYLLVFVINATASVLLWPADIEYPHGWYHDLYGYDRTSDPPTCPLKTRLFFFGLMLSSFGAGCVAAFLVRRAEASGHTKWACGYAIVNWIQAMLGSLGMNTPGKGVCRYGVIPGPAFGGEIWYTGLACCRLLLYLVASFWMQTLIASRLDLLEQSANRNYNSICFRTLMWAQIFGAAMALLPIAGIVYGIAHGIEWRDGNVPVFSLCAVGGITLLGNVAASIVAICSLRKSFLELRGICRVAETNEVSISARSFLRRARRFAGLQAAGVSCSLVFTLLLVPARVFALLDVYITGFESRDEALVMVCFFIQAFDALGNAVAVLLLSGSHRMAKVERSQRSQRSWKVKNPEHSRNTQISHEDVNWTSKMEELSMRGMTLRSFLQFYHENLPLMPDWKYVPTNTRPEMWSEERSYHWLAAKNVFQLSTRMVRNGHKSW